MCRMHSESLKFEGFEVWRVWGLKVTANIILVGTRDFHIAKQTWLCGIILKSHYLHQYLAFNCSSWKRKVTFLPGTQNIHTPFLSTDFSLLPTTDYQLSTTNYPSPLLPLSTSHVALVHSILGIDWEFIGGIVRVQRVNPHWTLSEPSLNPLWTPSKKWT